ncbi:MAG: hypothetical protein ACLFRG_13440 [Desulfococcaceae bacterium]
MDFVANWMKLKKKEVSLMPMPKDEMQKELLETWRTFVNSLEESLDKIEKDIEEAKEMAGVCTDEWCEATEHYIDDIANSLFSISEPRFASPEDSKKIKELKRRVYDLYANYKQAYQKAS